jgi:hypothetical protein
VSLGASLSCGRVNYDLLDGDAGEPAIDADIAAIDADIALIDAGSSALLVTSFSENGTGDISGVVTDTTLVRNFPDFVSGDDVSFTAEFDGSEAQVGLLRIDLSSLPNDATIEAVELEVYTNFSPSNGGEIRLYRMNEAWDEAESTWNDRLVGAPWSTPGAAGAARGDAFFASITVITSFMEEQHLIDLPVAMVQQWVDNPGSNFGIAFVAASGQGGFLSSESVLIENSPYLEVSYR